jgi:hypothetical protein
METSSTDAFDEMMKTGYTPEELAELLDVSVDEIRTAVFEGTLPATVVNHDIIEIQRSDAIAWLKRND